MDSRPSGGASHADLSGICGRGIAARQAGESYFSNPFYFSTLPTTTVEQFEAWCQLCEAWSAGWLAEDAGRDPAVQSLMRISFW
jgi:hypothetical protein